MSRKWNKGCIWDHGLTAYRPYDEYSYVLQTFRRRKPHIACTSNRIQTLNLRTIQLSPCSNAAATYKPVRSFILSSPKFPVFLTLVQINNKCLTRQQKQMAPCCCLQMSLVSSMERRRKTQKAEIFTPHVVARWPMLQGVTDVSGVATSFAAPDEELWWPSLTGNTNLKCPVYWYFSYSAP